MSSVLTDPDAPAEPIVAGPWTCSMTDYHADTAYVSRSMLSDLADWAPMFHGRYVTGTIPRREPTDAMKLGTALHDFLFEPDTFADRYVEAPDGERRSKAGREAYTAFLAANEGKIVIDADDYARVVAMAKAFMAHEDARAIFRMSGVSEQAFRWCDPETEILCKCRPDRLADADVVLDLKTASDISRSGIQNAVARMGYHVQAAFYLDGIKQATGRDCRFVNIFVESSAPFGVVAVKLDETALKKGRDIYGTLLRRLARHRETGDWTDPRGQGIEVIGLPRWAVYEEV